MTESAWILDTPAKLAALTVSLVLLAMGALWVVWVRSQRAALLRSAATHFGEFQGYVTMDGMRIQVTLTLDGTRLRLRQEGASERPGLSPTFFHEQQWSMSGLIIESVGDKPRTIALRDRACSVDVTLDWMYSYAENADVPVVTISTSGEMHWLCLAHRTVDREALAARHALRS